MNFLAKAVVIIFGLVLIPTTAVVTAAAKQRFEDGPNRMFSGGPLVAGELHSGPDPDWRFLDDVATIELQLLEPAQSRRIWIAQLDGKLYVWSGYMDSTVGRLWKSWPGQAERDGRAVLRIEGMRYERQLNRIHSGEVLEGIAVAIRHSQQVPVGHLSRRGGIG